MVKIFKVCSVIIAFAILCAVWVFIYAIDLGSPVAGYDHVVKLTSQKEAYSFADCVVRQREGHPKKSMFYLASPAYGPPKDDIVLGSRDKSALINIHTRIFREERISIIVRMKSKKDNDFIDILRKCA